MDSATVATSFLDALDSVDGEGLAVLLDDDVVYDDGHGNRLIGRQSVRDALIERVSALNERHTDRLVLVSQTGNRVAVESTLRGTYERALEGWSPADGPAFSVPAGLFFEIEGTRILRFSRYLDQTSLNAALS